MTQNASYNIVISRTTADAMISFMEDLASGDAHAGGRLSAQLNGKTPRRLEDMIDALLATKLPQIFAESDVIGDGSDWTMRELSLLGDINVAMAVDIFDNAAWSVSDPAFQIHSPPLQGQLLFSPGPLLQDNAPDLEEVTNETGAIDQKKYSALIERRIWPLISYANEQARMDGMPALIILPGIGCGAFAGRFQGEMAAHLDIALMAILQKHTGETPHIAGIVFDPFNEGENKSLSFGNIDYRVQPSHICAAPQLSAPAAHDPAFSSCKLYKIVAWDHASLPGNDYFINSRFTDDGVAAAATNAMEKVTGIKGQYAAGAYLPPAGFKTWHEVADQYQTVLSCKGNLRIVPTAPVQKTKIPKPKSP